MAESDVDIANMALTLLGQKHVSDLTEDSDAARAINLVYETTRNSKLRGHNWNFAQLRKALARHDVAPDFEFAYQYVLPTDPYCERVLETSLDSNEPWRIETYKTGSEQSRVIVTDATAIEILYLARLADVVLWDSMFQDAMSFELAYRISFAITHNATLTQSLQVEKEKAWRDARSRDGQESRALKSMLSSSFTSVR
jgi:hypothetical protein